MRKKRYIVFIALLTLVTFIASAFPVVAQGDNEFGCCANVDLPSGYCEADSLPSLDCCPESFENYGKLHYPQNQQDCKANYWKKGNCQGLAKCETGCCYDPTAPLSQQCDGQKTEDFCLITPGAKFAQSLGPAFMGSLCYKQQSDGSIVEKFEECPDRGLRTSTCNDFNGKKPQCKSGGCMYCASTGQCLSDCSSCPQQDDRNKDGECDGGTPQPVQCSDIAEQQACKTAGCSFCPATNLCSTSCNLCPGNQLDGNNDKVCDSLSATKFCSEIDTQQQCTSSSLGCSWCNTPLGGTSRCRPLAFGCSSCGQNIDNNEDKVCDTLGLAGCNDGIDNDGDGLADQQDFCCENANDVSEDNGCVCPASQQCTAYGIQQCLDAGGTRVGVDRYKSPDQSNVCCTRSCFMPACPEIVSGFDKNTVMTATQQAYERDFCSCGNTIVNSKTDNRFCCHYNDGTEQLQTEPCNTIRVTGRILDKTNLNSLAGHVKFFNNALRLNFERDTTIIRLEGNEQVREYDILVAKGGVYDITVNALEAGYEVKTIEAGLDTKLQPPGSTVTMDFELAMADTRCKTQFPALAYTISHHRCQQKLSLAWEPYACSVSKYHLFRSEVSGQKGVEIALLGPAAASYDDSAVEAGKNYFYVLEADLSDPALNNKKPITSASVGDYSGDEVCITECPPKEFCKEDAQGKKTMLAACDEQNKITTQDCSGILGKDAVCVPRKIGAAIDGADCKARMSCKDAGIGFDEPSLPNIFGMLYELDPGIKKNLCLGSDTNKNYCYMDTYDTLGTGTAATNPTNSFSTITDRCINCDPAMSCFDYKSGEACTLDNCAIGGANGCRWEQSIATYGELGQGICYGENDRSTMHCDACSDSCTDAVCMKLGGCYAKADLKGCNACVMPPAANPTRCEEYTTKASCVGNNPFSIPGNEISAEFFVDSDDQCGLGVCTWDEQANACFKDGDDNNNKDCGNNALCQSDTKAPATTYQGPAFFSTASQNEVTFEITDITYGTPGQVELYYCIDTQNTCYPQYSAAVQKNADGKYILKKTLTLPQNTEGMAHLRYFSIDAYSNVEPLRYISKEIDTIIPVITVHDEEIKPNINDPTKSDVTIEITSDEYALCAVSFSQVKLTESPVPGFPKDGIVIQPTSPFIISVNGLQDGVYQAKASCKDNKLNPGSDTKSFIVDTNRKITDVKPFDQVLDKNPVTLEIETLNDQFGKTYYDCSYKEAGDSGFRPFGIPLNPTAPIGQPFKYKAMLNLADGYHTVDIICKDDGIEADRASTIFSVDTTPPTVDAVYEANDGYTLFDPSKTYIGSTVLRFNCDDNPAIFNNLGPFGCALTDIKYCFGSRELMCVPNQAYDPSDAKKLPKLMNSSYFCYAATDKHNDNYNKPACVFAHVDNDVPQVIDVNVNGQPYNLQDASAVAVVKDPAVRVSGKWRDSSGKVTVSLGILETPYEDSRGEGIFSFAPVTLIQDSENIFSLTAKDRGAINGHNAIAPPLTVKIAHDELGPLITSPKFFDYNGNRIEALAPGALAAAKGSEYRKPFNFTVIITDPKFTKSVNETSVKAEIALLHEPAFNTGCKTKAIASLIPLGSSAYAGKINECLEAGNYSATISAEDALENQGKKIVFFKVTDTIQPNLSVTVFEKGTLANVSTVASGKDGITRYDIELVSTEPLTTISFFNLTFTMVTGEPVTLPIALEPQNAENTVWKGELIIVAGGVFTRLDNAQAQFVIKAHDWNGVESSAIIRGKTIRIDTFGPVNPPVFYTPQNEIFTSKDTFYITGHEFSDKPNINILIHQSNSDRPEAVANAKPYETATMANPKYLKAFMTKAGKDFLDERIIRIEDNQMTVFDPLERFDTTGAYFNFTLPRRHTGENYIITGINQLSKELRIISYSPGFEGNTNAATGPIYLQDKKAPPGWFGINVPLQLGSNYFMAAARDEHGNLGKFSGLRKIIFENRKPLFSNELPRNMAVISDNKTLIEIAVENRTPLASMFMQIGNNAPVIPLALTAGGITRLVNKINLANGLGEGNYSVRVNATDAAGNFNEFSWGFTITIGVPSQPEVSPSGYTADNRTEIRILFESGTEINITNATLTGSKGSLADVTAALRIGRINISAFSHRLTKPLPDDAYTLTVKASKFLSKAGNVNTYSTIGVYPGNRFVVDTKAPAISSATALTTNQAHALLDVTVDELNFQSVNITGGIGVAAGMLQTLVPLAQAMQNGNHSIKGHWVNISTATDGVKEIYATAYDKAGNEATARAIVLYDNTSPSVQIAYEQPMLKGSRHTNETVFKTVCVCSDAGSGCSQGTIEQFYRMEAADFAKITSQPVDVTSKTGNKNKNISFRCSARDNAGNSGISESNITIIREGPVINVQKPKFGGTHSRITPIEIAVSEPSSCTLHEFQDGAPVARFASLNGERTILLSSLDFEDSFDSRAKTIDYFIKCTNDYGMKSQIKERLLIDTTPLAIVNASLAKGRLVTDNLKNTIHIETNLDAQCRFAASDEKSPAFVPFEALPHPLSSSFAKTHTLEHDFGRNGIVQVYVDCIDKTEKTVSSGGGWIFAFEIDVAIPIQIQEAGIQTDDASRTLRQGRAYLTQDATPVLFVSANKASTVNGNEGCTFKRGILPARLSTLKEQRANEENIMTYTYSLPLAEPLSDATYTFDALCRSGLDDSSTTITFTVDTTAPKKPALLKPANAVAIGETLLTNQNLTISGTAEEDARRIDLFINNNIVAATGAGQKGFTAQLNTSSYTHGSILIINATAFDELGNGPSEGSNQLSILVDKISDKPTIQSLPRYTRNGKIIVAGYAEPNAKLNAYLGDDAEPITTSRADRQGNFSFELAGLLLGLNPVRFTAEDAVGNAESAPQQAEIIFDIQPPTIISRSPDASEILNQQSIIAKAVLKDEHALDQGSITVKIDNEQLPQANITLVEDAAAQSISISINYGFNRRGLHEISLAARDKAGNAIDEIWTITVTYPPACSDGKDNDHDSKIDQGNDLGCCGKEDDDEADYTGPVTQCSDGIDNEGDGRKDYCFNPAVCDKHCSCASDNDEGPTPTQCNDETDNDGNGLKDYCEDLSVCDPGCDSADDANETEFVSSPSLAGFTLNENKAGSENYINTTEAVIGFSFDKKVKIESLAVDNTLLQAAQSLSTADQQSFTYTLRGLADQKPHTFMVRASTSGGETLRSLGFTVDTVRPTIAIKKDIDTSINRRGNIPVSGTFSENFLDSIVLQKKLPREELALEKVPKEFSTTIALPSGNQEEVIATITDRAGNTGTDTIMFRINTTLPALKVDPLPSRTKSLPVNASGSTLPNIPVAVKVNDKLNIIQSDGTGRFKVLLGTNEGIKDQLLNTINVSVMNEFESRSEHLAQVLLDMQPPSIAARLPDEGDIGNFDTLQVALEDPSGIDVSTISLFINDEPYEYQISNGIIEASLEGIYKGISVPMRVKLQANDGLGNTLDKGWTFTIANGPAITFLYPANTEKHVNSTMPFLKIRVQDFDKDSVRAQLISSSGAPLKLVKVAAPGASEFIFYPVAELESGKKYLLEVRATRSKISESIVKKEIIVDTVRPMLFVEESLLKDPTNAETIVLQGRFAEENPRRLAYLIRSEQGQPIDINEIPLHKITSAEGTFEFTQAQAGAKDQRINVELLFEDLAGNTARYTKAITIDRKAPTLSMVAGETPISATGSASLKLRRKSDQAATVSIALNNNPVQPGFAVAQDEIFEKTVFLAQSGNNKIFIEAEDQAGNKGNETIAVYHDNIPPLISNIEPQNFVNTVRPTIKAQIADDSGIANVTVLVDGAQKFFSTVAGQAKTQQISFTADTDLADQQLHSIAVKAYDKHGNLGSSSKAEFLVDTSLPTLIRSYPEQNQIIQEKNPVVELLFKEDVLIFAASLNGQSITFVSGDNRKFTYQMKQLEEGQNTIRFTVERKDGTGKEMAVTLPFILDTHAPALTIKGLVGNDQKEPIITMFDAALGIRFSDEHMKSVTASGGRTFFQLDVMDNPGMEQNQNLEIPLQLDEGLNSIDVLAEDRAGNANRSTMRIVVDRQKPLLAVEQIPAVTNVLPVIIQGTTLSNKEVSIIINGKKTQVISDGQGSFKLEAGAAEGIKDQFKNRVNVSVSKAPDLRSEAIMETAVDKKGPTVASRSPEQGDRGNFGSIDIYLEDFMGIDYSTISISNLGQPLDHTFDTAQGLIRVSLAGIFKGVQVPMSIVLKARDLLGNEMEQRWAFTLDHGPAITFLQPPEGSTYVNSTIPFITFRVDNFDAGTVTGRLLDNKGALLKIVPLVNNNLFTFYPVEDLLPGDLYHFEASANRSRISQTTAMKEIQADIVRPVVTLDRAALKNPTRAATIDITGSFVEKHPSLLTYALQSASGKIADKGELLYQVAAGQGMFEKKGINLDVTEKEATLLITIEDKAGNRGSDSFTFAIDRQPPAVEILEPAGPVSTPEDILLLRGKVNEEAVMRAAINGGKEIPVLLEKGVFTLEAPLQKSGNNIIAVYATDKAGNIGNDTLLAYYDNLPPAITDITPRNPVNILMPLINATLDDDQGIASFKVFIDGEEAFGSAVSGKPKQYIVQQKVSKALANQKIHTLTIEAVDIHGNRAASEAVQFLVDTSIPTFKSSFPAAGKLINAAKPKLEVEYEEDVKITQASLDNKEIIFTPVNPKKSVSQVTQPLAEGTHALVITAARASRIGSEDKHEIPFIIDTMPPSLSLKGLAGNTEQEPIINSLEGVLAFSFADEHMKSITITGAQNQFRETLLDNAGSEADANKQVSLQFTDGINIIRVEAEDQAGNKNASTIKILVDTEGVSIEDLKVSNAIILEPKSIFKTKEITVDITGTYSENPVKKITLGQQLAEISSSTQSFAIKNIRLNGQPKAETNNTFALTIEDGAGNIKEKRITIINDQLGPTLTLSEPKTDASLNRRPAFRIRASEPASSCNFRYTVGSIARDEPFSMAADSMFEITPNFKLNAGQNPIVMACIDSLGNIGVPFLLTMFIEKELPDGIPEIAHVEPVDAVLLEASHYLLFRVNKDNEAEVVLNIRAEDDSGGVRCRLGNSPDSLDHKTAGYDSYNFSLNPVTDLFTLPIGTRSYYAQCQDKVGKNSEMYALKLTVDPNYPIIIQQTLPAGAFVNNSDGDFSEKIEITTGAMEAHCKIDFIGRGVRQQRMMPSLVNGLHYHALTTLDTDAGLLADGNTYTFDILCEDPLNNLQQSKKTISFTADYSIAQPTIFRPENETSIRENITVEGSAEEESTVTLLVNGRTAAESRLAGTSSFTFRNVQLRRGENIVMVISVDKVGNTASTSKKIFFSSEGPAVMIISPEDGRIASEFGRAEGRIISNVGIDLAKSSIIVTGPEGAVSGGIRSTNAAAGTIELVFNPPITEDGKYTIDVFGYDAKGREGRNQSIVTVDRNMPLITILEPPAGSVTTNPFISIKGTIKSRVEIDPEVFINNQMATATALQPTDIFQVFGFGLDGFRLTEGANRFNVTATNIFGIKAAETGTVILDTTGPIAKIIIEP